MKERIIGELQKIEQEFEVKICYAVEAGSREWGTASFDSDYDVRFIYVHQKDWYLSIDQKRDVIELPIHEQLDLNGWELRKALQLFKKSNPSLLEWLHSTIVYYQAFSLIGKLRELERQFFQAKPSLFHYLNMAKGNFRDCLQNETINNKRYLNVIRPILACRWIEKHNSFPPNNLLQLIEELIQEGGVKQEVLILIESKINQNEPGFEPNLPIMHKFFEKEINHLEDYAKNLKEPNINITTTLNQLFRDILEEVWGR